MIAEQASADEEQWQPLSVWSVAYFVVSGFLALARNVWALFPVVFVGIQMDQLWLVLGIASVALAIIIGAVLQYLLFRFRVMASRIEVRQGVLNRRVTSLEFARVQNVSIELPFYYRPLQLVTLKIDSAGSSSDEIHLSALDRSHAERLRANILRQRIETESAAGAVEAEEEVRDALLISRSIPDLIIHGLTNNRAWIIAGGAAAVLGQMGDPGERLLGSLFADLGSDTAAALADQSIFIVMLGVLSLALMLVAVVTALSVLGSILSYYGFELRGNSQRLTVRRGLLNQRETNLRKSRVQVIASKEGWLDRVFSRRNLVFEQIAQGGNDSSGGDETKVLVPSVTAPQSLELSEAVMPSPDVFALDYQAVSPRLLARGLLLLGLVYVALAVAATAALSLPGFTLYALGVIASVHALVVFGRYKRWGLALTGHHVVVRSGLIGVTYLVAPLTKIQRVRLRQTIFMGRADLSHIGLQIASRTMEVPMLPGAFAREVVDRCLAYVESRRESWM
ncbi:MAG: PH domain-containing protein [Pseudomonadaceae bacterium]|nr:PH domain-containing protein [Pseudomonadaceae bacterium]